MATEAEVRSALAQVQDPELGRSIVDLGMVRDLKVENGLLQRRSPNLRQSRFPRKRKSMNLRVHKK